jgi:hypothetical protein
MCFETLHLLRRHAQLFWGSKLARARGVKAKENPKAEFRNPKEGRDPRSTWQKQSQMGRKITAENAKYAAGLRSRTVFSAKVG